jgi:ATP-binding cassette subfamily G (WHITE) protein 2 (SNQ2)
MAPNSSIVVDGSEGSSPRPANNPQTPTAVSRVDVDFFDPAGLEELRRVLTEQPKNDLLTERSISDVLPDSNEKGDLLSASSSDITLAGLKVDEGLDLEKTVRLLIRK